MSQNLTIQCKISAADATTATLTPLHGGAQASAIPSSVVFTWAARPAALTVGTTVRLALAGGQ